MLKSQKGQALLIVVLVMVIALTWGLSVAARSLTNLKTSQDQANAQKALSAAEAGIERELANPGLGTISTPIGGISSNVNYKTTISQAQGTQSFLLNDGIQVDKNDHVYIWPSKLDNSEAAADLYSNPWNGQITIYWSTDAIDCNNAALEITIISGTNKNNLVLTRFAYDPCPPDASVNRRTAPTTGNNFTAVSKSPTSIGGQTLLYKVSPVVSNNIYLIGISPFYEDAYIGASADINHPLPPQGDSISSLGTSEGQVQRRVNAFKDLPQIPAELFPYAIFSQ